MRAKPQAPVRSPNAGARAVAELHGRLNPLGLWQVAQTPDALQRIARDPDPRISLHFGRDVLPTAPPALAEVPAARFAPTRPRRQDFEQARVRKILMYTDELYSHAIARRSARHEDGTALDAADPIAPRSQRLDLEFDDRSEAFCH
jgi:hypothetical protein